MQRCDVESQRWLLLYPVPGYTSWLTGGEEAALRPRTALPWITLPFFFFVCSFLYKSEGIAVSVYVRMLVSFFSFASPLSALFHSPAPFLFVFTPLRPALNYCMPIFPSSLLLPSLPPFSISPLLPLSSHSVRFDLTELSRLAVVPRLCGNVSAAPVSLINSPLSQSLLYFFFFFFYEGSHPPISSSPSFSRSTFVVPHSPILHSSAAQQLTCSV